jgi:hypothetical protein
VASIWAETAAWFGLPLVLAATAVGFGLLIERIAGVRLPGPLVLPVGACASIVLAIAVASVGQAWPFGVAALLLATAAGVVLNRHEPRATLARVTAGWAGVAAVAVLGLYMAPTALTGHWTWSGYNFVNDTAFQFVLVDWIRDNGIPYHPQIRSTWSETVRAYLDTEYPVGSHSHLAVLSSMIGARVDVVYASYISGLVALIAMALAGLAGRVTQSAKWAAAAAFVAAAASLTYHYALQGNIKEIAMLLAVTVAAATGREVLTAERPVRAVVAPAVAIAAGVSVYSAAAIPYIGTVAVLLVLAMFLLPLTGSARRTLGAALAVGAGVAAVVAIPALVGVSRSLFFLRGTFTSAEGGGGPDALAHLVRPLPWYQIGGVWLDGDYRVPVAGTIPGFLTTVGLVTVLALCVWGVVECLRRREPGPTVLLGACLAVYLVLAPRTASYADAKMLAILSPAVVLCAMIGVAGLWSRLALGRVALAAGLGGLVLGSAAFAYHDTKLAPNDRMADLEDLGERYAGSDRLMLFNEYEEFAKYYMRDAVINVPTEAITESFIELRLGGDFVAHSFDLDEMKLEYVERFPAIVLRRKPSGSRPPANYSLEYRNASYEVWRREDEPRVLAHMPVQGSVTAYNTARCSEIRKMAREAPEGTELVGAAGPEIATFDFAKQYRRPEGWKDDAQRPGELVLGTPGSASGTVDVVGGTYSVWLEGTFGRRMEIAVDGKPVGDALGINPPRAWSPAGQVALDAGQHTVEVTRPGGNLEPGDGGRSSLGAIALVGADERQLIRVPPERAAELCGRSLDWVEVVDGAPADDR